MASILAIAVPVLQNLANGGDFFTRPVPVSDVGAGFLLLFLCAFAGSSLGGMAHPGLAGNRKTAVIFLWIKC